jgi:hypothetical protein
MEFFTDLLSRATNDLLKASKFSEMCDILDDLAYILQQSFGTQYPAVNYVVAKIQNLKSESTKKMNEFENGMKPEILDLLDKYNRYFDDNLTFGGNVDEWFSRMFPLVVLYLNKTIKGNN